MTASKYFAILDTHDGYLQWSGKAATGEHALRALDADVGITPEAEVGFQVIEVTADQCAALAAWWEAGAAAPDYPEGTPSGRIYTAEDVRKALENRRGP